VQHEGGVDDHGAFITVAFTLPAGSFATVLMRELMKSPITERPTTGAMPEPGSASLDQGDAFGD
jgi:tRNA(Glu) U13 pseudouridine synthase TruD